MHLDHLDSWADTRPPAAEAAVRLAEVVLGIRLPQQYTALLQVTNGLLAHDHLYLYRVEDLAERNDTLGILECFPGHLAIGDDSGGRAVVISTGETVGPVYLVDMGSVLLEAEDIVGASLGEWLENRCPLLS
jgi:hypothetical protein